MSERIPESMLRILLGNLVPASSGQRRVAGDSVLTEATEATEAMEVMETTESPSLTQAPNDNNRGSTFTRDTTLPSKATIGTNIMDQENIALFVCIKRHQETGLLICADGHKPMVVLSGDVGPHLKQYHADDDYKVVGSLGKHLQRSTNREVPKSIQTKLPCFEVVTGEYCTACTRVYRTIEDHDCTYGHRQAVYCQFYLPDQAVVLGPLPVDTRSATESLLGSSLGAEAIAKEIGWSEVLKGDTKVLVGSLVASLDNVRPRTSCDQLPRKQQELLRRVRWLLTCAYHAAKEYVMIRAVVAGAKFFRPSALESTFNDQLNVLNTILLYITRTYDDKPKYQMSLGLKIAMFTMMDALGKLDPKDDEYELKKRHDLDDVDRKVLAALFAMVVEPCGDHYATHPWVCAMGTWALDDQGGFAPDVTYISFLAAMRKMARYIYIEKAFMEDSYYASTQLKVMNEFRKESPADIIGTCAKLQDIRKRLTTSNVTTVEGIPERTAVKYNNVVIGMLELSRAIKKMLQDAETILSDLFNVPYSDIPNYDMHSRGVYCYTTPYEWLGADTLEEDREVLVKLLSKSDILYYDKNNGLSLDEDSILNKMHSLLDLMSVLYYLTSVEVARASEHNLLYWRVSTGFNDCALYFYEYGGLVCVRADCLNACRNVNEDVLRYFPEPVSQLFMKVFRFAAPLYKKATENKKDIQLYPGEFHLFPQSKDWINRNVSAVFEKYLGVQDVGMGELRQILNQLYRMAGLNMVGFKDNGQDDDELYYSDCDDDDDADVDDGAEYIFDFSDDEDDDEDDDWRADDAFYAEFRLNNKMHKRYEVSRKWHARLGFKPPVERRAR